MLGSFPHQSRLSAAAVDEKDICAMAKCIHKNMRFTCSAPFIVIFVAVLSFYEVSLR